MVSEPKWQPGAGEVTTGMLSQIIYPTDYNDIGLQISMQSGTILILQTWH